MNNALTVLGIVGIGIISGVVYRNYDILKIKVMSEYTNMKARQITIDFFENLLEKNPDITLDQAILEFEDVNNEYKDLENFSQKKHRSVENYREAYKDLFEKAKKKV
tara:strand:+ start:12 stop:332 length:321 start_codon:yes stop_codon:yes gene_type:complete